MITFFNRERFERLPDAVLLDLDNTLYAYDPPHQAAMAAVRTKAVGMFSITPEQFDQAFERARNDVKQRLPGTASSHSRLLYFQRMLEMIGLNSQVLLALDLEQSYWRVFLSHAELFEGVREFLDDLRCHGIPSGIVTDLTAQIQFRKLVYFGLDHYVDYLVTSEETGFDKPNPAPFKLALEKIRPAGSHIWMIGDNLHSDIQGARESINALTLQKIHAGVDSGANKTQPDALVKHFSQLSDFLRQLTHRENAHQHQVKA